MAYCIRCGANAAEFQFCPQCGTRLETAVGTDTLDSLDLHETPGATLASSPVNTADLRPLLPPVPALPSLPTFAQPIPDLAPRKRWTGLRVTTAATALISAVAIGFLLTYFLIPTHHTVTEAKANVIPPPLPQPAAGAAASYTEAPAATTTEGKAYQQLSEIAARDKAALQSNQLWRAQIASSPANQSAVKFLARYQKYLTSQPNLLLAWSGDWPHTWGPSSRHSWVLLSSSTNAKSAPILSECAHKPVADRCWAIRLSTIGTNSDNEDVGKPDANKN